MASNDSYYDEDANSSGAAVADGEKDAGASATGLLPKSVLMGKDVSVGDELTFKVTAIHDDEIQVECESGAEHEEPKDESTPPPDEEGDDTAENPEVAPPPTDSMYD